MKEYSTVSSSQTDYVESVMFEAEHSVWGRHSQHRPYMFQRNSIAKNYNYTQAEQRLPYIFQQNSIANNYILKQNSISRIYFSRTTSRVYNFNRTVSPVYRASSKTASYI